MANKTLTVLALVLLGLMTAYFSLTAQAQSPKDKAAAAPALSEKAQQGKAIFADRCFVCHDVDSARVKSLGPPSLNGLFKHDKLVTGKPVTPENVKEIIKTGPTPNMPAFRYTLSDQEIDLVVEYLKVK